MMFLQEELEALIDASENVQTKLLELEAENERLGEIAEETLNNGWGNMEATMASLAYRAQQLRIVALELASAVAEIGTQLNRME